MKVFAQHLWNDTTLDVKVGETLHFLATGQWKDFTILTDANGFDKWYMKPFEKFRRKSDSPWFSLIGAIDGKHLFHIGQEKTVTISTSGRLFLFANDVKNFYWNNKGFITVQICQLNNSSTS